MKNISSVLCLFLGTYLLIKGFSVWFNVWAIFIILYGLGLTYVPLSYKERRTLLHSQVIQNYDDKKRKELHRAYNEHAKTKSVVDEVLGRKK